MAVEVRIPAVLRPHTGGRSAVDAQSGSLRDVLIELAGRYPEFGGQVLTEEGGLHRFVNVYVDDEDARFLEGLDTKVTDGAVVSILPAVAGGQ